MGNESWVNFKIVSIEPVTEEQAQRHQTFKGYIPMGYGFYKFKCERKEDQDGKEYFEATWKCSTSCE